MHIDARELPDHSIIEGDICIVGAGAAGISMALEWIGSPYKVILLEGGGFEYDDAVQELYAGKTTGQRYYPLKSARLHYFGGTTGHWSGWCSTFDQIDFEKRDWIPKSGWPIKREELDPYYPRAHKNLELGPYEYDWKQWQKNDPELKPIINDESIVWNKIWQFSPPTRFGSKYKDAIVNSQNVHLYTYANLTDITANENVSAIRQVTVKNHAKKEHTVKAKHFILACCSIQNARILLAANKQAAKGLGNDNDNVGRYFMEHLEIKSGELWLTESNPLKLYTWSSGTKARCEMAISKEEQIKHQILNGTASVSPLLYAKNRKPMIDLWDTDDPQKNLEQLRSGYDQKEKPLSGDAAKNVFKSYELFTRIEQAPNPDSRISLDQDVDALGMRRAMLHWELTPLEKRSIWKIHELIGHQIGKAGIGRVKMMEWLQDEKDMSWPAFTGAGWHHMGTTRMSDDPKNGVVDANCKVHGIANLHIAGASCYTTAGAVNPTLTLVALTIRLADRIKKLI